MTKKPVHTAASIRKKALLVFKKQGVKRAGVFGSLVKGTATSRSDVDFLIEYKGKNTTLFDLVGLKLEPEETVRMKVDRLTYRSIHARLRDLTLAEQLVIL